MKKFRNTLQHIRAICMEFADLRRNLADALGRNRGDVLLLSGGIDSGILAYLSPEARAITLSLDGQGRDVEYASALARSLGLCHTVITIGVQEALSAIR
ncbi:MAG: hypothetical protein JSW70_07230, partial [Syntrophobacterales bacterium]